MKINFFRSPSGSVLALQASQPLTSEALEALNWLFSGAEYLDVDHIEGYYVGPRREMISPWSTNAVEITQNMNLSGITRIEEYYPVAGADAEYDPMLQVLYSGLDQQLFHIDRSPEPIRYIEDIRGYNEAEGLALSDDEIGYLTEVSQRIGRPLTDSELFGFSQVNSEHCRHKIFGGTFVIDGEERESSLFAMIKATSAANPNFLVSAYKDNVAFVSGPRIEQFAPASADQPDYFQTKEIDSVLSLKAETHNFPTTVEPFNGAATGTGGEIRDRMAGGRASIPLAGTAVYMTSYPRTNGTRAWEAHTKERPWIYQTPRQILTKASNGASDFGNKFGQPLICGSVLTYEHQESPDSPSYGFDKVIMLAGGIGFARKENALKGEPKQGEKVVLLGGDNYRIGMGGGAVSSVNTGQFAGAIELNAIQRANPEMQKRTQNVIRAMAERDDNPIVSIHDHGAGGHLNCLSELVEATGGRIDMDRLPVGDPTLSAREIIGNESQERMGLLVGEEHIDTLRRVAERERAPLYVVGETTDDMRLVFAKDNGEKPIDLALSDMFGNSPKTIMQDSRVEAHYAAPQYEARELESYIDNVLRMEAVACKDWLTNKVDRSVTGRVARQQCQGELQLPLSDCGAMALDFRGRSGIATSIGHAPAVALADPAAGSVVAIAEALTNIVFAPLTHGLSGVSLSANWMWPCRNAGEDARLYDAVEAAADFAISLGINIPTGKDSLSMTQKYPDGQPSVISPGTVIISAAAEVEQVKNIVSPVLRLEPDTYVYHIDFSFAPLALGGSAFAQSLGRVGEQVPTVEEPEYFRDAFAVVQDLIRRDLVLAGHDISAGGLVTALLEMCFANTKGGLEVDLSQIAEQDLIKILFAENPGILVQVRDTEAVEEALRSASIGFARIARPTESRELIIKHTSQTLKLDIDAKRELWYESSYLMDLHQTAEPQAQARYANYKHQPVGYTFPAGFTGKLKDLGLDPDRKTPSGVRAAIVRDKGTNGEREMAYALFLAGFDVKDVHLTDLTSGRETLEDVQMLVFCGGFSNSDVLGSAKGWAAGILYNERAKATIDRFYARPDTLSLGICNGCQLMAELELLYPDHELKHKMQHNESGRFESSFVSLEIPENKSVMLGNLSGCKMGIWVAHGEGKFSLPYSSDRYNVIARYAYDAYPANPNGSPEGIAGLCSMDGRHLAMMPHPERAIFPWQCGYYPADARELHEVSPWMQAFRNAYLWLAERK
ncbi:phosphoribosylformylglycinamidine synthase [Porphyromonas sp. COT-290 OH3588]|uniref:phosphoribosylformylglycinamidine synthase n=1 Tax=Porphyromonas sp. COT-290 OH3588 TaxID=1515617 RepID=UPI00052C66A6|nr:phosphoribosylformylglycinamidine synthase [Porphyromonas sp. COT-290 OH3588]KGO00960.1 phosphoribosylformylglycinamidine synthase [Porphyromonas sp. COT-290 OH3588]